MKLAPTPESVVWKQIKGGKIFFGMLQESKPSFDSHKSLWNTLFPNENSFLGSIITGAVKIRTPDLVFIFFIEKMLKLNFFSIILERGNAYHEEPNFHFSNFTNEDA